MIWYLVGVIFVLRCYPRDVAVVSILMLVVLLLLWSLLTFPSLSWCDTAASTVGRAWGRYTPKLPSRLLFLPIAPRKSLAGTLGATVTGALITFVFWGWAVTPEYITDENPAWHWSRGGWLGLSALSLCSGIAAGITEALGELINFQHAVGANRICPDIGGLDDNLTLPIISGALIWGVARLISAL